MPSFFIMKITFYNTSSANNKIQKELKNALEKNIKLKMEGSILTPILNIKSDEFFNYNYCYIENFKRYYYINDIEIYPNKIYVLHLEIDVLMSFKEDILNSRATINRETIFNKYYDSDYQKLETFEEHIYKSDVTLSSEKNIILSTLGGL